ncbi:hypothetical protein [uncultured Kordia sp.]|nr:hypothetical protein [uncultured Kordia sp.]
MQNVTGNLNQVSGGKPPKLYRYCDNDICKPSESRSNASWCNNYC